MRGTYVYVIAWSEGGPSKIGLARTPQARIRELQVGCPHRLEVWFSFECARTADAYKLEQAALRHYEGRGQRLVGEWVRARPASVVKHLEKAAGRLALEVKLHTRLPEIDIADPAEPRGKLIPECPPVDEKTAEAVEEWSEWWGEFGHGSAAAKLATSNGRDASGRGR